MSGAGSDSGAVQSAMQERQRGKEIEGVWLDLPADLQHDARDFFGSYRAACEQADLLLASAGDPQARSAALKECPVGKLTPEALYLDVGEVGLAPPVIRVYEGCGRVLAGTVADANVVKLHRIKSQVSYLSYPEFDRNPHPALATSVVSRLARLDVTYRDFRDSANPPILHRKETFVGCDYPGRGKFAACRRSIREAATLRAVTVG
jgi:DNA phosphorothioation-associated putative methyltransferase